MMLINIDNNSMAYAAPAAGSTSISSNQMTFPPPPSAVLSPASPFLPPTFFRSVMQSSPQQIFQGPPPIPLSTTILAPPITGTASLANFPLPLSTSSIAGTPVGSSSILQASQPPIASLATTPSMSNPPSPTPASPLPAPNIPIPHSSSPLFPPPKIPLHDR